MSLVKALPTSAAVRSVHWCAKNWDLFLLRILPLAGVVSAGVGIAHHRAVVLNALVLNLCAAFFVTLRQDVSESSDRIRSSSLPSTPLGVVFGVMKSAIGMAISDEDVVTDDHSCDGRRVGWAPLDGASTGTLEMQANDGLALTQCPILYFEAALKDRVQLVTPHQTSGESSLGCSDDHLSLARVVGQ